MFAPIPVHLMWSSAERRIAALPLERHVRETLNKSNSVIPANAGIQKNQQADTGFRRCDE